jgi:hypothetical protein
MPIRTIRCLTAAWLIVLLGVLHTGLPSHRHEVDPPAAAGVQVLRADHHAHGTLLVEQTERVPSTAVQLAAVPVAEERAALRASVRMHTAVHVAPVRPLGRSPPPANASRAPPRYS